jgi:hypothetical protein
LQLIENCDRTASRGKDKNAINIQIPDGSHHGRLGLNDLSETEMQARPATFGKEKHYYGGSQSKN